MLFQIGSIARTKVSIELLDDQVFFVAARIVILHHYVVEDSALPVAKVFQAINIGSGRVAVVMHIAKVHRSCSL